MLYPLSTVVIWALGCVSPGHMMLAPDSTNLMAPLSTRCCGSMNGYWCSSLLGMQGMSDIRPLLVRGKCGFISHVTL